MLLIILLSLWVIIFQYAGTSFGEVSGLMLALLAISGPAWKLPLLLMYVSVF